MILENITDFLNWLLTLVVTKPGGVLAASAFIVSLVSIIVAIKSMQYQRRYYALSLKPIPELKLNQNSNSVEIVLKNNGSGPMIIHKLKVEDRDKRRTKMNFHRSWGPGPKSNGTNVDIKAEPDWIKALSAMDNKSLSAGDEMVIVNMSNEYGKNYISKSNGLKKFRVKGLGIRLSYSDIYENKMSNYSKEIIDFETSISSDKTQ